MFRKLILALGATAMLAVAAIASASAQALIEENTLLEVTIGNRPIRLEAMIVRPAQAKGRLPIALITHGRNRTSQENAAKRARDLLPQARDFAHRGWLAVSVIRRGFGLSDGPEAPRADCVSYNFRQYFERSADDLAAALEMLKQRPDADPTRALAIGVSAGGATALALAARRPDGLVGVVNVSGGLRLATKDGACAFEPGLVSTFAHFGAQSRVPTLWLYAENDSLFGPALARQLHGAFTAAGGRADLVIATPIADEGHRLWGHIDGRRQWLPPLDRFLIANALPTWNRAVLELKIRTALRSDTRQPIIQSYLAAPSEKVLAMSRSGRKVSWSAGGALETARQKSLENCEQQAKEPCMVMLENFEVIAGTRTSSR